jgi:hypothetical protein
MGLASAGGFRVKLPAGQGSGFGMDQAGRARAHRREQAVAGFPLLSGCPSTFVLRRLVALKTLTPEERVDWAEQLSDLAEAQAGATQTQDARAAVLARLPLIGRVEQALPVRPDLRFQSVKNLARLAADPGGIAGFIRLQEMTPEAESPPAPHVPDFEAAVPTSPAALRKAMLAAVQARFGGERRKVSSELEQLVAPVPRGQVVVNLGFAGKGAGAMARQMDYSLWADLDGVRMVPTSYEALWLLPAQWDLITVGNLEAAAAHLPGVIEARLALAE